jgi:FkbM family methyltransferase
MSLTKSGNSIKRLEILGNKVTVIGSGTFITGVPEGRYHDPVFDVFYRFVKDDSVCIDVGANIGVTSIALALLARRGSVLAIEPDARNLEFLKHNVSANKLKNVTIVNCLVGALGTKKVYLFNAIEPGCSTSISVERADTHYKHGLEEKHMPCVSLDTIIADHHLDRLDFIKLDIEGGELDALAGAKQTLARFQPTVLMEFNAHCLMNFARINPPDALNKIMGIFPHVRRIAKIGGVTSLEFIDELSFMTEHVLRRGCVDNLLCSFRPLQ